MTIKDMRELDFNPYEVLGIAPGCSDSDVLESYKQRGSGPETDRAFSILKTEKKRLKYDLLGSCPSIDISDLVSNIPYKPGYKGPEFWYSYLK